MKKVFLMVCIIFAGILTACGSSDKSQETQSEKTVREPEVTTEESADVAKEQTDEEENNRISPGEDASSGSDHKEYDVGDTIRFTSGLEVTIVDSGLYTKPNLFDDTVVDTYAFLDLDMENTGEDDIAMTGSFFQFYADGYVLRNTWLNEDGELPLSSNLSSGRKVKGRVYAEGPEISSAKRIEAELGEAVIRVYEEGDYGIDLWDMEEEELTLEDCLGALYSIYGGDVIIELYMDADGNLCVMEGNPVTEYVSYSQTYDSYMIKDDTLYGYVGELADEFVFEEDGIVDGHVEVLLSGSGSTHYQTYIQEEEYFNTNWREAFGMEQ